MRTLAALALALPLVACSTKPTIGPEPDSGRMDASSPDGSVSDSGPGDGGSPDGSTSAPGWVSGTRLRAHVVTSSDGAKGATGVWRDTMRQEDCAFRGAVDGKLRCLPVVDAGNVSSQYFSDAQCTTPYVETVKGCTPKYAVRYETFGACPTSRVRIFQVGTGIANPTVYVKSGNQCVGQAYNSNMPDLYINNVEVQPAVFAEGVDAVE